MVREIDNSVLILTMLLYLTGFYSRRRLREIQFMADFFLYT